MKNKCFKASAIALMLVLLAAGNLFAAGGSQSGGGSTSPVTLNVGANAWGSGFGILANTYYADLLLEDLGIRVNTLDDSPEAQSRMLAAGEWVDVARNPPIDILNAAIKLGLLVNFDEHKAKLPNVYANAAGMLQYHRDYRSNGTGGLYALSSDIQPETTTGGTGAWIQPHMRWDLYKQLGMPEINELEDYIPVIKQMVDLYPVTEDGQKVYGVSTYRDANLVLAHYLTSLYGAGNVAGGWYEYDAVKKVGRSRLDADSYYKRTVKFIFSLNQAGLLDPDAFTQEYAGYREKNAAGRVVWSLDSNYNNTNQADRVDRGKGFAVVPFKNMKTPLAGQPNYLGGYVGYTAAKSSPRLDKALEFLDYLYSFDGLWKLVNGPKGIMWDIDASGEPYVTRQGANIRWLGAEFPSGGLYNDGIYRFTNMPGLSPALKHPVYNRRIDGVDWIKKDYEPQDSALVKDWQQVMNATDTGDYYVKNGMGYIQPTAPMDSPPANISEIETRLTDLIGTECVKAVLAGNEAEFNAIWDNMVSRAKVIGIDTAVQWRKEAYDRAVANGSKYEFK
jgi:putative aldouronate transport system substrate-binding protein